MTWYWYAIFSAVLISLVGLFQKKTLQNEHSLQYVTIFRTTNFLLFLLIFAPTLTIGTTSTQFFFLGLTGLIGATGQLFVARSLRALDISTVMPILALDPALVALLAFGVLGEKLAGFNIVGIAFVLIGAFVLESHRKEGDGRWRDILHSPKLLVRPFRRMAQERGGRSIIIALFAYAVSGVIDRFLLKQLNVTTYLFYVYLFGTTLFLLLLLATKQKVQLFQQGNRLFFPTIIIAAVMSLFANISQAKATSLAAVGLVIAVKRASVLIDIILGGRLFHEHHIAQKLLASAIILLGLYLIVI
ncbi:MAG: EamA family transporter [Candidatus Kerfeldbacteria bacterium]